MKHSEKFRKTTIAAIMVITTVLLASCANQEIVAPCLKGHTFGFLGGLLHGFIAPFDLIAMLFRDDVTVYAPNNNGAWYAFGFLIGSGGWGFFGGNRSSRKKG